MAIPLTLTLHPTPCPFWAGAVAACAAPLVGVLSERVFGFSGRGTGVAGLGRVKPGWLAGSLAAGGWVGRIQPRSMPCPVTF